MKYLAIFIIKLYQRFISPYKGFVCAYHFHTGKGSCSKLGYRAIRFFGIWRGMYVLQQRLVKCGITHRRYTRYPKKLHKQSGYCDFSCDLPCDTPSFDLADCQVCDVCNLLSNCPTSGCGDWPSRNKNDDEQWVHIPPKINRTDKK